MSLVRLELGAAKDRVEGFEATVLFAHDQMKIRRIELAAGTRIPPCQMQEDVVFVVLTGRVAFRADGEDTVVAPPDAVFIPGGATTRSMAAQEKSLVLAILCGRSAVPEVNGGTPGP